jgi:hypothetical protein
MCMTALETAVVRKMLADPQLPLICKSFDPSALEVSERNHSEVGFITSFARIAESRLFGDEISMRWSRVVGRLNSETDVDFVVFVDDGFLTGVEGCTFGEELWPPKVEKFELMDLPP